MKVLVLFACMLLSLFVHAGHEGGGGQRISANFVEYARYTVEAMKMAVKEPKAKFTIEQAEAIEAAILVTEVYAVPANALCSHETDFGSGDTFQVCKDAWYNAVKKYVLVNEETWKTHTCLQKMALVLHEYGRAASLENANYAFSSYVFTSQTFKNHCSYISGQERDQQTNQQQCK